MKHKASGIPSVVVRRSLAVVVGVLCWLSWATLPGAAQNLNWGVVAGRIVEADLETPVGGAHVIVEGTTYGTVSDARGDYVLRLPAGRHVLRVTALGYRPHLDTVVVRKKVRTTLNVVLAAVRYELEEVQVSEVQGLEEAGGYRLRPEHLMQIPAPLRDGFRALKVVPGVASNNELSGEYSVRGGGFNENAVYLDGYEVYRSFRLRKGEQEGLGLINPELVTELTFYTGGFPARYGGKLASVLDVRYARPYDGPVRGSLFLSLLEQGGAMRGGALGGKLGWSVGVRRMNAAHLFQTRELKGRYQPYAVDGQVALGARLSPAVVVEALGVWMRNRYRFEPRERRTLFGSLLNPRGVRFAFDGDEHDRYETYLGGIRVKTRFSDRVRAAHDVAFFETREQEHVGVDGVGVLYEVGLDAGGLAESTPRGAFLQQERFSNDVLVRVFSAQGRWTTHGDRYAAEGGWSLQRMSFTDRLAETSLVGSLPDSVGTAFLDAPGSVDISLADSLVRRDYRGAAHERLVRAGLYLQHTLDLLPAPGLLIQTTGIRADYNSFNGERTVSPRMSLRLRVSETLLLTGSWGLYHQTPAYRELRGDPVPGEPLARALNRDIRAQRALHVALGTTLRPTRSNLRFRIEAYYKRLDRLITYDVENIRLSYSGQNDARGFAYGVDVQVYGEFLPGLESWMNYSFMRSRERFLPGFGSPQNEGWLPRPFDQTHTVSLFIQDYLPEHPMWKLHLRFLYGSGFPYTPPRPNPGMGGTTLSVPTRRHAFRYPAYSRADIGFAREIRFVAGWCSEDRPLRVEAALEILNVFDYVNTITYDWAPDASGLWQRIPSRLTPRTLNLHVRMVF
ncbi:MAG: TonB-dependent receptor [Rhodothermaceae bacterium]|nr:MAG: TonB-dependent receptor [Rhodothermaceae bacterium]